MRRTRIALLVAMTAVVAAAIAGSVMAAGVGQMVYSGCVSDDGSGGKCADAPGAPIGRALHLAVSPDSESLYVLGNRGASIAEFSTTPRRMTYKRCTGVGSSVGECPGANSLFGDIAVSSDGDDVYVSDSTSDLVRHFSRASSGRLTYEDCVSDDGTGGRCTDLPIPSLDGAAGIDVSRDGKAVYVTGSESGAVTHFKPSANGKLRFEDCIDLGGRTPACTPTIGPGAGSTDELVVSPDGDSVYVTDTFDNRIFELSAKGGKLSYKACISQTGNGDLCSVAGPGFMDSVRELAVSRDGDSLYSIGGETGVLTHFRISSSGKLSVRECASSDGEGGCADIPGYPLENASSLALSRDGKSLYATGEVADTISRYSLDSNGTMTYGACISSDGNGGQCGNLNSAAALHFPHSIAVSPDGAAIYVSTEGSVLHIKRKPEPPKVKITGAPPAEVKATGDSARVEFKFKADREVTLECRLDSPSFKSCDSPKSLRAGIGRHEFQVRGTDLFGQSDKASTKFRVVFRRTNP